VTELQAPAGAQTVDLTGKYVMPGIINLHGHLGNTVDLTQDANGDVVLSVMDDGVGIADGIDVTQPATLGLQLVTLLTGQLGGTLSVQRTAPTRIVLQFPGEGRQIRAAAERTDVLPAHK